MSQQVQNIALTALHPHERNSEFFSDIDGEEFERLKDSIREQGILTPLRIANDMTIISGHQRYRAAKEVGLTEVPVIMVETTITEDEKLTQLIASNFGRIKNDPIKQSKWIAEYEKLKGIKVGRPSEKLANNCLSISQADIAKELGVSESQLKNIKRLATLPPELQAVISEGRISATTGYTLLTKLTEEEQKELIAKLPDDVKMSGTKVQEYIKSIRCKEEELARKDKELETKTELLESKKTELADKISILKGKDDELIKVRRELIDKNAELETAKTNYASLKAEKERQEALHNMLVRNDDFADDNPEIAGLYEDLDKAKEEIKRLEEQVDEKQKACDNLQGILEEENKRKKEGYIRYACGIEDADEKKEADRISKMYTDLQSAIGGSYGQLRGLTDKPEIIERIPTGVGRVIAASARNLINELEAVLKIIPVA